MFGLLAKLSHSREMRESKDEMLVGEIVRSMARQNYPSIAFRANDDRQTLRFLTIGDPVLYSVTVVLDRRTGGNAVTEALVGSKATLRISAEVRNKLSDPDDLIKLFKTDVANIMKMPVLGGIKVNHAMNSIYATTQKLIELDDYVGKDDGAAMHDLLSHTIAELKGKVAEFKK